MFVLLVPPVITLRPSSVVTDKMKNVVLSCNTTSIVPITFYWEFSTDNDTWETLPSGTTLVFSIHTTNIIIMNTTISSVDIKQSDEDSYRCRGVGRWSSYKGGQLNICTP